MRCNFANVSDLAGHFGLLPRRRRHLPVINAIRVGLPSPRNRLHRAGGSTRRLVVVTRLAGSQFRGCWAGLSAIAATFARKAGGWAPVVGCIAVHAAVRAIRLGRLARAPL